MASGPLSEGGGRGSAVGLHFSDDTSLSARNPRAPNAYAKRPPPGETTPAGGCCPPWDGVGSPDTGEQVLPRYVADGDDTTTTFFTAFPYLAGTLTVKFNSKDRTYQATETNPATGQFDMAVAPTASPLEQVFAGYFAA